MGDYSSGNEYLSVDFPYPTPISPLTSTFSRPFSRPPTNLLILGATGTIGSYITHAIIDARPHFGRICVYTSEKTIIEKVRDVCALDTWGVEIYVGELTDEHIFKQTLREAEIDTIISCVGRAAIEKQIPIITWAEECNVTRFFPSEYGTDIEYFPDSKHEPPHQMKLAVREHMEKCSRMEHTYLVTGPYSDIYFSPMREQPEAGSFDVKLRRAWLLGNGEGQVSFTAMADVGKFVVAALINYATTRNSTLIVHSFTSTPKEILAEFEKQTRTSWEVNYTSLDQIKTMEKQAYQIHSPMAAVFTLRRIWTQGGTLYKFYDDSLLGQFEPQSLEEQVRRSINEQVNREEDDQFSLLRKFSTV